MTDERPIKVLECCANDDCDNCPSLVKECKKHAMLNALDLIKRYKAEIERLEEATKEAVSCFHRMESLYNIKCMELKVAKAEAIKEFAERLKADGCSFVAVENGRELYETKYYQISAVSLDCLVKEMKEETK